MSFILIYRFLLCAITVEIPSIILAHYVYKKHIMSMTLISGVDFQL